jgi:hypothetical protein
MPPRDDRAVLSPRSAPDLFPDTALVLPKGVLIALSPILPLVWPDYAGLRWGPPRVGSDRSALPISRWVDFSGPPSEPDVRLSPHPALHMLFR